jgi:hypothetical protein
MARILREAYTVYCVSERPVIKISEGGEYLAVGDAAGRRHASVGTPLSARIQNSATESS